MKVVFGILGLVFSFAVNGQTLRSELERIITHDTEISYDLTPGFIIGIVDGDSTFIESFGHKVDSFGQRLDQHDIFEVGSVTKLWTAALVDILVSQGLFDTQTLVNDLLPDQYKNPRMEALTINDLIHHQSSLPRRPYGFGRKEVDPQNPYAYYEQSDLLSAYSLHTDVSSPATYSHMNYALVQIALELSLRKKYDDLLSLHLFQTLGMTNSFISRGEGDAILTPGVDRSGTRVGPWTFSSFHASEGGKSTLSDMLAFLKAHLALDKSNIVLQDNFEEKYPSFEEGMLVSHGWQLFKLNKRLQVALHTGHTDGHSIFIGLVPATQTGVVVMSNSAFGTKDLGMLILRMVNDNWKRKPN